MGTRNLTVVRIDDKVVVAKYCQWDGYPSSAGVRLLNALNGADLDVIADNARKSSFIDDAKLQMLWRDAGADDSGWVNMDISDTFKKQHPLLHRDTPGAGVIEALKLGPVITSDSFNFGRESLFCEWAYLIDLDAGTFQVYKGFNKDAPVGPENPWFTEDQVVRAEANSGYFPVSLVAVYGLNELPTAESLVAQLEPAED